MISSKQNAWFRRVREAIEEHGEEIVLEGPKMVRDAIAGGWQAVAVVVRDGVEWAPDSAAQRETRPITFAPSLFDSLRATKTSQGVLGLFQRPQATLDQLLARRDTILVALDGVQDPGNVGTIIRLAAAFDAGGVALLRGCADAFSPKSIRSSAGAILSVPVAAVSSTDLLAVDRPLFAADGSGQTADPPARDAILVFGSEGGGLSDAIASKARKIAIATSGRVESLNVAASAAILLSRSFAQR